MALGLPEVLRSQLRAQRAESWRFPSQLGELLKHTRDDDEGRDSLRRACAVMQRVTRRINEEKRRAENVEVLRRWQERVLDWKVCDWSQSSALPCFFVCALSNANALLMCFSYN